MGNDIIIENKVITFESIKDELLSENIFLEDGCASEFLLNAKIKAMELGLE